VVTIALVGDVVLMRPLSAAGVSPDDRLWAGLRSAAWVAGNLEVPLTDHVDPQPWGMRSLRAPAERRADLRTLGLDAVSLANNHSSDQGWTGLLSTRENCRSVGIDCAGIGQDRREALEPLLVPPERWSEGQSELPLAMIAVTCVGHPGMFAGDGPGVASLIVSTTFEVDEERVAEQPGWPARVTTRADAESLEEVLEAVRRARAVTPLVIVSMHWGVTLQEGLADYQLEVAQALAAAGAAVIFGHQSHVLQAVEWLGDTPVFYGLGSFVFHYEGDISARVPDDTVVGLVDLDPATGSATAARLLIGRLDAEGVPTEASPEWSSAIAERVLRASDGLQGSRAHVEGCTVTLGPGASS